ncbi:uncharacterized protein LOC112020381 [Quercus suber]|uniref:uncharacterized protein LOC112020381 n=1 Tax=Quercus suber TaxID=58331 RepID=UPI000CE1C1DB|nr:uncharacterized protein LOC112020381 [Quercus suber]
MILLVMIENSSYDAVRGCLEVDLKHYNVFNKSALHGPDDNGVQKQSTDFVDREMAKGLIWATAEDLARNRGRVVSLYRQILRSINSPKLPLTFAARLAKKAEVRAIFLLASEETSLHNIADLIDTAEYSLSLLRKGEIPKYIQ